jgi:hypothetical protein
MSLRDDELLERAAALRAEGRAFLDRHAVEARLAKAGPVVLVGSVVTGLMVWRDLDVCVDARGLARPVAWRLVLPLVHAADRVRYEHLDGPDDRRHYFVLGLDGWKLDLSLFTHGIPPEVDEFQSELLGRLDDDIRLAILRLKELWHGRPDYPEVVGGYEICSAVLAGVRTPLELDAYLEEQGVPRAASTTGRPPQLRDTE